MTILPVATARVVQQDVEPPMISSLPRTSTKTLHHSELRDF